VSVVEPGAIKTPIWEKGRQEADRLERVLPGEARTRYTRHIAAIRKGIGRHVGDLPRHPPGELLGIPATGRTIEYVSHEFYRIADGRIAEEWICSDMAILHGQLTASDT
jgi:hypothetical protein